MKEAEYRIERRRLEGLDEEELLAVLVEDRVAMIVLEQLLHVGEHALADHEAVVFEVDLEVLVRIVLRLESDRKVAVLKRFERIRDNKRISRVLLLIIGFFELSTSEIEYSDNIYLSSVFNVSYKLFEEI